MLPRQRYFPPDATVDRWLRSSPVEVAGAAIGRINARLLDDGRIEFAFTPTDGEQITPQARYFPANARVGRWLRSTEIAIGPPAAGYIAVSAGGSNTCAIREDSGAIECWGQNEYGQTDAPDGSYTAVSAGKNHTCALREEGGIRCWGWNAGGKIEAPDGSYTVISAGDEHTCAIRASGAITCWGSEYRQRGQTDAPEGSYAAVSAGRTHTCAIRDTGAIECWGENRAGQSTPPD